VSPTGKLIINLSAISENWCRLSERIKVASLKNRCGAVVKADAYGLGMNSVSEVLWRAGCRDFFVATLDEAIALRQYLGAGPSIMVFGGLSHGGVAEWFEYQLLPIIIELGHLEIWGNYCRQRREMMPCALKADTGMHRLGVPAVDLLKALNNNDLWRHIDLKYFISHLACADNPKHPLNKQQLATFTELSAKIKARYPRLLSSLANSSGLFLGDCYYFDLARPGIALYGGNPTPKADNPMRPVVDLELPTMQARTIAAGETVGYGATFTAQRETRLVTVFGGYADGLLRSLSNRACGYANGYPVQMVGRVSMDSLVFDVSDMEYTPKSISLLNEKQTVDDLASQAGTVSYEILTSLGHRYQRVYKVS
jgi:alanine racemase